MKKLTIISAVIFMSVCLYAQRISVASSEYPWHLLEQGKLAYEAREFGKALLLFRQAREMRKTQVETQYDYLFAALKAPQVRAAGDLIADVYRVLEKRQDYEACAILDNIFLTHPPVYFDKSRCSRGSKKVRCIPNVIILSERYMSLRENFQKLNGFINRHGKRANFYIFLICALKLFMRLRKSPVC